MGDRRTLVLALGEIGLIHVMLEDRRAAREVLERTLAEARAVAWNAFLPYPEALLGILEVSAGDAAGARERLEHAFALACQIRDCCWEGMAAAGLALLDEASGDVRAARDRFEDARRRSVREPDAWLWGHAFVLDLACAFAVRHGLEEARRWVGDLELVAARTGMREFLARASRYRHDLGDPSGLEVALALAAEVDNPALRRRIERVTRVLGT